MNTLFPTFHPLMVSDQSHYTETIKHHPPVSDIAFSTLLIWWNFENKLKVSSLNDNLVIHYFQPFDAENSGLSLIGTNAIDQSIVEIFDYQKSSHQYPKLIHVPEFVIGNLKFPEKYNLVEEPDYHEYILDSSALYLLDGASHGKNRRRVGKFIRETEGRKLEVIEHDLSQPANQQLLFTKIQEWGNTFGAKNDPTRTEEEALKITLSLASSLGISNLCLYVDDELYGVALYESTGDNKYLILHHLKVNYSIPKIFDYMTMLVAKYAHEHDIPYINMEMDLGLESMREHKMGLRPINFLKKFTVTLKDLTATS